MELMTSRWTDDRMDDLKHQVDDLGLRMEQGFAEQRREMNIRFDRLEKSLDRRFEKVDERFEKVDERFEKVDERFERMDERFERVDERFEAIDGKIDARFETAESRADARLEAINGRFEKADAKFEAMHDQIARTQETILGLHATLTRFSLWLAGAVIVAVIAALMAS
ncbi:MAG TPA: hypothetical protein VG898_02860 [Solirubrobacterales bacterium]|nr:hypothetical protein [Solirubrobacterales bacterium]